jgi:AcrR family transcriptional regulator
MSKSNEITGAMSRSALRRMREKEQRYNAVLRAAESLFASKGYHQTSIEEIADLAEASTGMVYFYFRNKEDLLMKLMEEIGFVLRKWLGEELAKTNLSLEGLSEVGVAFLQDFCVNNTEKITIFFRESVGQSREVEEQRKNIFVGLVSDIKEVVVNISKSLGRRFISDSSSGLVAVCMVGIYERIACHYLLWRDESTDIMDIAEETASFMRGGIEHLLVQGDEF